MQFRMTMLAATLALVGLSQSASAQDTGGWYLGLGTGWDHLDPVKITPPPGTNLHQDDSALIMGSVGYRFADRVRLEAEIGWERHGVNDDSLFSGTLSGTTEVQSWVVNVIHDWDVADNFSFSAGGGVGIGTLNMAVHQVAPPATDLINDINTGLMLQGIVGMNYEVNPGLEIFADYRYRILEVNSGFASDFSAFNPIHVSQAQEHVAMVGIRWYLENAPPSPPPPPQ
jgi:OOP family OmpA-OmpF porin